MKIIYVSLLVLCLLLGFYHMMQHTRDTHENLTRYVEAYYTSMAKPQITTPEAFVWFTGINMPVFNSVTHFTYQTNIESHLDNVLALAPKDKSITVWIDALQNAATLQEELAKRNFKKMVTCPFMTWHVTAQEKPSAIITRVTPETFSIYLSIIGSVFGLDEQTTKEYGALHAHSTAENYIIYDADTAVGTGTLFVSNSVGLILNIAILPEFQRKGLGSAISQFLMHRAHELGLEKVVLNANPGAIAMYQKLGFEIAYDLTIYMR